MAQARHALDRRPAGLAHTMRGDGAVLAPPPVDLPHEVRAAPPPLHGGPLTLLRFMRRNGMLNRRYALLLLRLAWLKLRFGAGACRRTGSRSSAPACSSRSAGTRRVVLGRWSWLGHGTKVRAHEGEVLIGAKSVLGQECTISAYQHVSIGRECIVADRVMLIDFDHGVVEVERPIRLQGIYKRDVRVGNNVWIGYGACILRGVTVGDNAIVGTTRSSRRTCPPTRSPPARRRACCACATSRRR